MKDVSFFFVRLGSTADNGAIVTTTVVVKDIKMFWHQFIRVREHYIFTKLKSTRLSKGKSSERTVLRASSQTKIVAIAPSGVASLAPTRVPQDEQTREGARGAGAPQGVNKGKRRRPSGVVLSPESSSDEDTEQPGPGGRKPDPQHTQEQHSPPQPPAERQNRGGVRPGKEALRVDGDSAANTAPPGSCKQAAPRHQGHREDAADGGAKDGGGGHPSAAPRDGRG